MEAEEVGGEGGEFSRRGTRVACEAPRSSLTADQRHREFVVVRHSARDSRTRDRSPITGEMHEKISTAVRILSTTFGQQHCRKQLPGRRRTSDKSCSKYTKEKYQNPTYKI